jgi:hypothetical protein
MASEYINLIMRKKSIIDCIARKSCPKFTCFRNSFANTNTIIAIAASSIAREIIT